MLLLQRCDVSRRSPTYGCHGELNESYLSFATLPYCFDKMFYTDIVAILWQTISETVNRFTVLC